MSREQDMARLRAAANTIAAERGINAAIEALETVRSELRQDQWRPSNAQR